MIDHIFSWFGYQKAIPTPPSAEWLHDIGRAWSTQIDDSRAAERYAFYYQTLSWVQIAVHALSQVAAGAPFCVQERSYGEELQDIPSHPFELLLQRPNPWHSRFELLEATFAFRALTGNAYWFLNRPDMDAPPSEIWIIPSHMIHPIPDGKSYIKGYRFTGGTGQSILLEPWEVVHFRRFHPINPFLGLSPLEALQHATAGDLAMQRWNRNFFSADHAKVPGALAFADPINDSDWEHIKHELRREHGGTERRLMLLRGVGQGGVQWLPMAISQTDMQFLEGRRFTKEEIFAIFAPGLASVLDVSATEANAIAGRSSFIEFAVWPALCAVAEKITNDILPAYADPATPESTLVGVFTRPDSTTRSAS